MSKIQNALLSVSDKTGLVPFARELQAAGIQLFSTGGTRAHLEEAGLEVHDISAYTGFPEMMDGRLKTLHPKIFGGILARRDNEQDLASLHEHAIRCFDLVVVNLYPFEATIAKSDCTFEQAIEKIDIGGPSLVRAAAKNQAFVAVVTDPQQYARVADEIREKGNTELATRHELAVAAFQHTAAYDRAVADHFEKQLTGDEPDEDGSCSMPQAYAAGYRLVAPLRYGENPHQQAALYADAGAQADASSIVQAEQLNGKALSYNNYLDLDAALSIVRGFEQPTAVVIKHNNPCGLASAATIEEALQKALDGDPASAFGSIVGLNRGVSTAVSDVLVKPGLFIEAIVAAGYDSEALEALTTKPKWKQNVRLMSLPTVAPIDPSRTLRPISGGALLQDTDDRPSIPDEWQVVTQRAPDDTQMRELRFAWEAVRHVRSNAIAICRDQSAVGIGAGQMSRVDAVEIAIRKAGERCQSAVLSSDAFFPFPDSIHAAAQAGIQAVIQPGGSKKDGEVIEACDELGVAMMFTGRRHFKH